MKGSRLWGRWIGSEPVVLSSSSQASRSEESMVT